MNKKLAIILVNWNQYELTKSCIMSIFNCSYQNFKIIVVDNCSKDKSVSKLNKDFPKVHFILNNSNLGFTGANNKGIEYAKSEGYEYIMLLNNDTEVDENFYPKLHPHITRSYSMIYNSKKGKTSKRDGYFWDEKGEKVIEV